MAKAETWQFTIISRRTGKRFEVTFTAKRQADVLAELAKLKAPLATVRLVRTNGLGVVRRFCWDTPTGRVTGVRVLV